MVDDVGHPLAVDPNRPRPAQAFQELFPRPCRHLFPFVPFSSTHLGASRYLVSASLMRFARSTLRNGFDSTSAPAGTPLRSIGEFSL